MRDAAMPERRSRTASANVEARYPFLPYIEKEWAPLDARRSLCKLRNMLHGHVGVCVRAAAQSIDALPRPTPLCPTAIPAGQRDIQIADGRPETLHYVTLER